MDMLRRSRQVAGNVRSTLARSDASLIDVAEAANVTVSELESRLDGREDFDIAELVHVGGFLRVSPVEFFEGVA